MTERPSPHHVLCVRNDEHPASLVLRRVYRRLDDPSSERRGLLRVVDESGDDYLYPASWFVEIDLPDAAARAFEATMAATER